MKQEVVPTSPKSTERPHHTRTTRQTVVPILVALVFGIAGGVVGSVYTQNIIQSIQDVGNSSLFHFTRSSTASTSALSSLNSSIAAVYSTDGSSFSSEKFVDYAVVMSTDGWLVLSDERVQNTDSLVVKLFSGAELPVQQVVKRSDLGVVYVRTSRVDLKPVSVAHADVNVGSPVTAYAATPEQMIYAQETVTSLRALPAAASSLNFVRRFTLDTAVNASAPLFNDNHELVGWQRVNGEVVPVSWIASGFGRINETAQTPVGISYTPVQYLPSSERDAQKYPDAGWLVSEDASVFLKNDIITSIDGTAVGDADDLATTIAEHTPGAQITVVVTRNGETQNLSFTAW